MISKIIRKDQNNIQLVSSLDKIEFKSPVRTSESHERNFLKNNIKLPDNRNIVSSQAHYFDGTTKLTKQQTTLMFDKNLSNMTI